MSVASATDNEPVIHGFVRFPANFEGTDPDDPRVMGMCRIPVSLPRLPPDTADFKYVLMWQRVGAHGGTDATQRVSLCCCLICGDSCMRDADADLRGCVRSFRCGLGCCDVSPGH